jgi:hypothetical protein
MTATLVMNITSMTSPSASELDWSADRRILLRQRPLRALWQSRQPNVLRTFRTVAHPVRAFNGALRWANEWESWGLRLLAEDLANVHADQYATRYRR